MLGAPLIAIVLLWLTSSESVMGKAKNGIVLKGAGLLGLVLLLAMAYRTAFVSIPQKWNQWMASPTNAAPVVPDPAAQEVLSVSPEESVETSEEPSETTEESLGTSEAASS